MVIYHLTCLFWWMAQSSRQLGTMFRLTPRHPEVLKAAMDMCVLETLGCSPTAPQPSVRTNWDRSITHASYRKKKMILSCELNLHLRMSGSEIHSWQMCWLNVLPGIWSGLKKSCAQPKNRNPRWTKDICYICVSEFMRYVAIEMPQATGLKLHFGQDWLSGSRQKGHKHMVIERCRSQTSTVYVCR